MLVYRNVGRNEEEGLTRRKKEKGAVRRKELQRGRSDQDEGATRRKRRRSNEERASSHL